MNQYHKIQSVYKRDPETKYQTFLEGQYSLPEFELLKDIDWVFTEKVDGTNIRAIWDGGKMIFKGKSDKGQIPSFLLESLQNNVFDCFIVEQVKNMFNDTPVCFYGEGYGAKIQKGGGNYRKDTSFVLFDIMCDGIWLTRGACKEITTELGIEIVPILGCGTLGSGVEMVKRGFNSTWGEFLAEGIVAKPKHELLTRHGERIITKVKHKDYREVWQ